MEAVLDTGFTLSYLDEVLNFLFPLFPPLTAQSPHIHSLTRLIVSLSNASLVIPLFVSLVPKEKLVAYQLAFDLAEGGSQEFLASVREGLPSEEGVGYNHTRKILANRFNSLQKMPTTQSEEF